MKFTGEQKSDISNILQRVEDEMAHASALLEENDLEALLESVNNAAEWLVRLGEQLEDING